VNKVEGLIRNLMLSAAEQIGVNFLANVMSEIAAYVDGLALSLGRV
jgi:hypothetical protein